MVVIMEVKIKYLVKYTIESTILKLYLDKIQITELKKSIRVNKKKINWFYPGQPDYESTYIFNQVVFS